jgi:hypothetical protein
MGNQVTLTLAGDSDKLEKAFSDTTASATKMETSVKASGGGMAKAMSGINSSAVFLTEGIAGLGDAVNTLSSLSREGAERADRLARAQNDVSQAAQDLDQALGDARQATIDLAQSQRDGAQSAIDVEQATLDAEVAASAYALAVKENGESSVEARQAAIDLKQAQEDLSQAQLDANQATEDGNQALLDNKQAAIDVTGSTISLHEAQRGASPPTTLTLWTERLSSMAPLLFTVIGATNLMTAATWASTVAFLASPITWIVIGIIALIAVIVLIATKTTWFQDIWRAAWNWIKSAAVATWDWLSELPGKLASMFMSIGNSISAPFKAGFNAVSNAWNNTVGKLSWTIPSWVPIVGGNSISAPKLPTFHRGGIVPGTPGEEVLAVLQAGERVSTREQQASAANAAANSGTTNVYVTLRLEDLKQLKDLQDFLDLLRNNSRRRFAGAEV